jgi:hypothetical protein
MSENLRKLLEYLVQEELDEQNALAAGGVAATSTGLALNVRKFRPAGKKRKRRLTEINTVYGTNSPQSFADIESEDMDAAREDADLSQNDDTKSPRKDSGRDRKDNRRKKKFKFRKSEQGYNPVADTMWNYGDKPTGDTPATRVKYIALEESVNLRKKQTVKVIVDKQLQQKSFETIIDFIKFTNSILKLNNLPAIYLHTIKKPEMTTGMFNRQTNTLHVLVGKRLIVDVLRTIAHELTHAKQHEAGLLDIHLANIDFNNEMADIDTPYENEAYTLAGNIVKIFCRKYPKITKDELYQLNEVVKKLR